MNVGIIGCGVIGQKRSKFLCGHKLVAVSDTNISNAYKIASESYGTKIYTDYIDLLNEDIDIVIISTTNNMLAPITYTAVKFGKHVLVEKPGAIHYSELEPIIKEVEKNNIKVKIAYNLRYHPAISEAMNIYKNGEIGELMFVRINYGHGGRVGYEKEWRSDSTISGGGSLIDLGVHAIDLSRWFLGDFLNTFGIIHTYFWNMSVEDNAFLTLETIDKKVAHIQVSCTEWRNKFSFEIFGKKGKLHIEGLGGSYGTEKLTLYNMHPEMGIPEIISSEYVKPDISMKKEFEYFVNCVINNYEPESNLKNAYEILKIVEKIYK